MKVKVIALAFCFFLLVGIIELIREEKLTFKYSMGWFFVILFGMNLAVFDSSLESLSRFFCF